MPQRQNFGVSGGVVVDFAAVMCLRDDLAIQHRNRADGHIVVLGRFARFFQRHLHPEFVIHSAQIIALALGGEKSTY
jgi:hypothetical protein